MPLVRSPSPSPRPAPLSRLELTSLARSPADNEMMSVDEFRTLMKEDWQLSQFWSVPRSLAAHSLERSARS